FYLSTIVFCSGKYPFRKSPVPGNEMPGIAPAGVGEGCKYIFKSFPDLFLSREFFTISIRSGGGLKDAIISHMRHDRIDVVGIESISKGLKKIFLYTLG